MIYSLRDHSFCIYDQRNTPSARPSARPSRHSPYALSVPSSLAMSSCAIIVSMRFDASLFFLVKLQPSPDPASPSVRVITLQFLSLPCYTKGRLKRERASEGPRERGRERKRGRERVLSDVDGALSCVENVWRVVCSGGATMIILNASFSSCFFLLFPYADKLPGLSFPPSFCYLPSFSLPF